MHRNIRLRVYSDLLNIAHKNHQQFNIPPPIIIIITIIVRVETIDGSANEGEDYVAISETLTFEPYQKEKEVITLKMRTMTDEMMMMVMSMTLTFKPYQKGEEIG